MSLKPHLAPTVPFEKLVGDREVNLGRELLAGLIPPLVLIVAVLGSIMGGIATPTEASGVGALGAMGLALAQRQLDLARLREIVESTTRTTAMVFFILIGAALFSLVFRGYGGDELVQEIFEGMPGGVVGATIIVMAVIFLLGFILDFIEITFVVVPIVGPVLLAMGLDPVWLGVMIAVNLQTSFLTPPFGFALFYLRGVAPPEVRTTDIYRGDPFIVIQLLLLALLALAELATWPGSTLVTGALLAGRGAGVEAEQQPGRHPVRSWKRRARRPDFARRGAEDQGYDRRESEILSGVVRLIRHREPPAWVIEACLVDRRQRMPAAIPNASAELENRSDGFGDRASVDAFRVVVALR